MNVALGVNELDALQAIFKRRVTEAVSEIPDMMNRGKAIAVVFRRMGGALVEKFDVRDVVDIPRDQFTVAREFLEALPVTPFVTEVA